MDGGDRLFAIGEVSPKLKSGVYKISWNYNKEMAFVKVIVPRQHNLYFNETEAEKRIINEVETFFGAAEQYKKLGIQHRRGFLLHGLAGTGKTSLITQIQRYVVEDLDGIVLIADNSSGLQGLKGLTNHELNRPCVIILEDIEELYEDNGSELLDVIDGHSASRENVIFMATTNNLGEVPDTIKQRPSRFDLVLEMPAADPVTVEHFINHFLPHLSVEKRAEIAAKAIGMPIAHVKEVAIRTEVYGDTVDNAIAIVRQLLPST